MSQPAPDGAVTLWGEARSSGTPVFVRQIHIGESGLPRAVAKSESIQRVIVKAANGLLGRDNQIGHLNNANWLVTIKNDRGLFARLLHAIYGEHKRVGKPFEQVVLEIAERASRSPRVIKGPLDLAKNDETQKALTMIWYTIILLDILQDPERLTQDDIDAIRGELQRTPAPPLEPVSREADAPAQPIQGEVRAEVGFVGGSLTDASVARALLDSVSNLSLPSFPSLPSSGMDHTFSAVEMVGVVQERLDALVDRLVSAKNPREVHDSVVLIPSWTPQAFVAARFTPDVDLAPLLKGLETVTRIALNLQYQKEHNDLFRDQIQSAVQSCVECWTALTQIGIALPTFDRWPSKTQGRQTVQNVSIEPVPVCEAALGRWTTPAERGLTDSGYRGVGIGGRTGRMEARPFEGLTRIPSSQVAPPTTLPTERIPGPDRPNRGLRREEVADLSLEAMMVAIRDTVVAEPPAPVSTSQYSPQRVDADHVRTEQVSPALAEIFKLETVEDLLELE
jgi:hypothetical protein